MSKLFLLDVDETLIDTRYRLTTGIHEITRVFQSLQKNGSVIGLNSDTALQNLIVRAQSLTINGPIIAERGALIAQTPFAKPDVIVPESSEFCEFRNAFVAKLLNLPNILTIIGDVSVLSNSLPILERHENTADKAILINNSRQHSLAFFARQRTSQGWEKTSESLQFAFEIAETIGRDFPLLWSKRDEDKNPKYGICILHHQKTRKKNALNHLPDHFEKIFMIGDSMSDWLDDPRVIQCAVSNAQNEYKAKCAHIAHSPRAIGVIELIEHLS